MKHRNLISKTAICLYLVLVAVLFTGCLPETTPRDLEPVINGQFKQPKAVHYPSTDYKVAAVVVDKDGNVWYIRMNAKGQVKDNKQLFNVSEYCH